MDELSKEITKYIDTHPEFAQLMRLFNTSMEEYKKAVEVMGVRRETKIVACATTNIELCKPIKR